MPSSKAASADELKMEHKNQRSRNDQEQAASNFSEDNYLDDDEDYEYIEDEDLLDEFDNFELQELDSKLRNDLNLDDYGDNDEIQNQLKVMETASSSASKALVKVDEPKDEDDDINSDEEREILKGIREDIEDKVRGEMKDELLSYQERMKALEEGHLPGRTDDEKNSMLEEDEGTDPRLKEAIIKMNKLDRILGKKVKREKEVKRERILLERRMRDEISKMEHGAANYREIKINTEKFLALAPPPSHNEGVSIGPEEEEEPPPLFQTQIDDVDFNQSKKGRRNNDNGITENGETRSNSVASSQGARSKSSTSGINGKTQQKGKKNRKDFIKRNKELAAAADQPVAMTDDEKKRLQTLLEDVDDLPEIEEGELEGVLMESNPFQVSAHAGEGFCPDNGERQTLTAIDQKLKGLIPDEDFRLLCTPVRVGPRDRGFGSTNTPGATSEPLFTRVGLRSTGNDAAALERFGERVLYETKEERELKARLVAIESQLELFKAPQDTEETPRDYHLTDQQLDNLLDQCARNMGSCMDMETPESTPRSQLSSRQSLLANPPRLSDEQLQQLLSDAHFPLSSKLLALREDDEKMEEEDGTAEVIRAETWIAIRDTELGDDSEAAGETDVKADKAINGREISALQDKSHNNENVSMNNTSHVDPREGHSNSSSLERRAIDEFMYTPDISNSTHISGEDSSSSSQRRESFGGARPKNNSGILPRLPQQAQFSSSSSSLVAGSFVDEGPPASSFNASSFATSSGDSFDSNTDNSLLEGAQTPVRLPDISANSFLIQTSQGMNNDERLQPRDSLPSRQPLQMVHNNLSDMSLTSMSCEDNRGSNSPYIPPTPPKSFTSKSGKSPAPPSSGSKSRSSRRLSQNSQDLKPSQSPVNR